ncbi:MAG: ABC transporter substrate-binding protein [Maricaulaceae bacterium]|nr:ABC transporter substrate-binding protein [Maricaulaceae bacterium]
MRPLAAACIWAFACAADAGAQGDQDGAAPARAVSASLCADAYLLALADPAQVAAVSWQAGQGVSAAPDWARALPRAWAEPERLLALAPDLVVFGPGEGARAARFLDRAGVAHLTLRHGEDFETVFENLRLLGAALGRPAAAEAAAANIAARLSALSERAEARGRRPSVFYLSASGGTAGSGTAVDAVLAAAGAENAAAAAGARGWTRAEPEWVVRITPGLVVKSYFNEGARRVQNMGERHAVFRRLLRENPSVEVPGALWPCAGPGLVEAAEIVADALDSPGGAP